MIKLNTPRSYAAICGVILFLTGFLGFAFRSNFDAPNKYLFGALILGFWGIVVSLSNNHNTPH